MRIQSGVEPAPLRGIRIRILVVRSPPRLLSPTSAPPSLPYPQASDQYLLEGLKRLCENAIAQSLTAEAVVSTFEYSEQFSAPQLGRRCLLYILEHYDEVFK